VYVAEDWELVNSESFDFENDNPIYQGDVITTDVASSGKKVISTDEGKSFSCNLNLVNPKINKADFAIVSFNVLAFTDLTETDLILEYKGDKSTYRNYNFNDFIVKNEWNTIQLKYDVPSTSDSLVLYFWNKDTGQKAFFDDVEVEFYTVSSN
jgi:hypothetical protein